MKTILKITTVLAVMLVSVSVMATEPLIDTERKNVSFRFNSKFERTEIYLKDVDENIIFSDFVPKGVYSKQFDFSKTENGTYYFIINSGQEKIIYTLSVKSDKINIETKKKFMKPSFEEKDGVILVNFLNLHRSVVHFDIYDADANLILSEKVGKEILVKKAFDFKKTLQGTYTLVLRDDKNSYYKQVTIK